MKLLLFAAAFLIATPAIAAERSGRAHFEKGQKLSKEGRYAEAITEFEAAYAIDRRPLLIFNVAECARLGGDRARARNSYERYLREDPQGKLAELARQRLGELGPATPPPAAPPPPVTPEPAAGEPTPPPQPPAAGPLASSPPASTPPAITTAPRPPEPSAPIYKRWPFWVAVGVVVVGGTVAAIAVTSQSGERCAVAESCLDLR